MTNQEMFNKVLAHLRAQGRQSRNAIVCAYRGKDGLRCAIGALMPDEVYRLDLEGQGVFSLPHPVIEACGIEDKALARELQIIHDSEENWSDDGFNAQGETMIRYLAEDWGLTYEAPNAQ